MTSALSGLDPLIHPRTRLQLMATLVGVTELEFATARDLLEVSDSVLSKHLSTLADAGYVRLRKAAVGGRQRTWIAATGQGHRVFQTHARALEALVAAASAAAP